jgi:tRNA A-37 threonylcarbamoyl transferase component Bud32
MFKTNLAKFSPDSLYSFFPKNKRLKLSKQGINFISNAKILNYPQNNNFLIINGLSNPNTKAMNQGKNFNSTNYKWNYNYNYGSNQNSNSNLNSQKFTAYASSTGNNFYKGKITQSSYGRKFKVGNGYRFRGNSQKKNLKMTPKKNMGENKLTERVKSVGGGGGVNSLEQKSNKIIEHFFNHYESNVKKVLYEMGVVGSIKDKVTTPLSRGNNNEFKIFNKKTYKSKNEYNNLPFLNKQNKISDKIDIEKQKNIFGNQNLNPSSETNIININNYINFYNDPNNITYNNNNLINSNNNINYNSNPTNNAYGSLTNTTLNNNLATNSTNSNIGNNNIIFGNSNISKKNSFNNFSFNANNLNSNSRSINAFSGAFQIESKNINLGESNQIQSNNINILSADGKNKTPGSKNNDNLKANLFSEINQKKARALSTAPQQINKKIEQNEQNPNIGIISNINNQLNNNKDNISSSIYNSATINYNKNDKLAKYEIGHTLGKGAYAKVKIVTNINTKEKFAMKIYDKDKLNDNSKKKCVYREIEILKRINHKNIAKLVEVINTQNHILIVQELVNGISLRDYYNREIRNQKGISEHKANIFKKIFKQIFDAMNYLHKNYMAHRDIKLENILMTKEYEIKIIDFGFGMYNPENKLQNFFCGTPNYMSPEIAFKKPYVGQKADLWSLGVLVYKMYCADFPFKGKNEKELYKSIKKGKFVMASYTPEYIKKIIVNLIELDPNKRWSCEYVLHTPWLKD